MVSYNPFPRIALPRTAVRAVAVVAALVWVVLNAAPAFADEFEIGILVDPAVSDATFMEGFQLAVDQSPDVSHPAGVEGGDHLGSIDVVMVVVDDAMGPDEFRAATALLTEGQGVAIIVADVAPDIFDVIAGPIAEAGTMLIIMSDFDAIPVTTSLLIFAAANQGDANVLLTDRTPTFQDAFLAAYGRTPTEAAIRGYIAGRLVDAGVEATDRNPFDIQTLAEGLAVAVGTPFGQPTDDQPASPMPSVSKAPDTAAAATEGESPNDPQVSSGSSGAFIVLIVIGIFAVAGLGIRSRARGSNSSRR